MQAGLVPAASFSSLPTAWREAATGLSRTWGPPWSLLPLHLPFPSTQGMSPQKMKLQTAQAWMGAFHGSHDPLLLGAGSAGGRQWAMRLFCLEAATPLYGIFNV